MRGLTCFLRDQAGFAFLVNLGTQDILTSVFSTVKLWSFKIVVLVLVSFCVAKQVCELDL